MPARWKTVAIAAALAAALGRVAAADVVIDMPPAPRTSPAAAAETGRLALDRYVYARNPAYPTSLSRRPSVFFFTNDPAWNGWGSSFGWPGWGWGWGGFGVGVGWNFGFCGFR